MGINVNTNTCGIVHFYHKAGAFWGKTYYKKHYRNVYFKFVVRKMYHFLIWAYFFNNLMFKNPLLILVYKFNSFLTCKSKISFGKPDYSLFHYDGWGSFRTFFWCLLQSVSFYGHICLMGPRISHNKIRFLNKICQSLIKKLDFLLLTNLRSTFYKYFLMLCISQNVQALCYAKSILC